MSEQQDAEVPLEPPSATAETPEEPETSQETLEEPEVSEETPNADAKADADESPSGEQVEMTPAQKLRHKKAQVKTEADRVKKKVTTAVGKIGEDYKHSSEAVRVDLKVIQGRNLVAKDRDAMGFGEAVSSDPYVKLIVGGVCVDKTEVVYETLNPKFKYGNFHFFFEPDVYNAMLAGRNPGGGLVRLRIYDHDRLSKDDNMGTVFIPLNLLDPPSTKWYPATPGSGKRYTKNASGEIEVSIKITLPDEIREAYKEEVQAGDSDNDENNGIEAEFKPQDDGDGFVVLVYDANQDPPHIWSKRPVSFA